MDPLSDVLSLLKVRSYGWGGFDAGGDWSVRFGAHDGMKFYTAVSGSCWLAVEGVAEPVLVRAGDCFLLPRGRPFRVASDLALPSFDLMAGLATADDATGPLVRRDGVTTYNGGGGFFTIGGFFSVSGDQAGLLAVLPPVVHIREEADRAVLRWCLDRLRQEMRDPQPGGVVVAQQLATMMLVQVLRLHLGEAAGVGWVFALADRQMRAALGAMHGDPARRWTLHELAAQAGMSRTAFAVRFKETVGASPMDYLTRWRMLLAGDRLTNERAPVSVVAPALGYQSESAFGSAFKRVMGCSPRRYARQASAQASTQASATGLDAPR